MGSIRQWLLETTLVLGLVLGTPAPSDAAPPGPRPALKSGAKPGKAKTKPRLRKPRRAHRATPPEAAVTPAADPVIASGLPAETAPMPALGPTPVLGPGDPTLRRPYGCVRRPSRYPHRVTYACAGDEIVSPDVIETVPNETPVIVPSELVAVFRTCPFEVVPSLEDQSDRFIAYEDPDVGRCYIWAPLDREALARAGEFDRKDRLGTVHPFMAAVLLRAVADAAARGDKLRILQGAGKGSKPSWHTFGLAVDVNLAHRKGLGEATAAYLDGSERAAWVAFAATAEQLGLHWLGRKDAGEIFHFEWRPCWTGLPRGDIVTLMSDAIAKGGVPAAWAHTRYDPSRPTAFKALRD